MILNHLSLCQSNNPENHSAKIMNCVTFSAFFSFYSHCLTKANKKRWMECLCEHRDTRCCACVFTVTATTNEDDCVENDYWHL